MAAIDLTNTSFHTAVSFVNGTNKHLFVTGKAGTGKTTFLRYIKENCFKKMAVVAPTGVAAINAGGVTLHSFFQLPFGTFLPGDHHGWQALDMGINNANSLLKNLKLPTAKRDVIKELELLVIDEVSMVRADLLDAVDTVLRHIRKQPLLPFGGVQMIYIGDLFQLSPVVSNSEWEILKDHYQSPFFFHAQAVQKAQPMYIELKKIYRQRDDVFINLLNNVRNNCCTAADLQQLHQYYKPSFTPPEGESYITLTTHNASADHINRRELDKLPTHLHSFEAKITGEFSDRSYPVDKLLVLKEGAQVMFIKNDKGETRRYYNGKLATIKNITSEKVVVAFKDEEGELELEPEVWRNIRYNYNSEEDSIEEDSLGTFSQFPIRLAWAITIHKSQGLTFDRAVIDAGASFAPGQVYVALSRLTSLSGLILLSRINASSISTDTRILSFANAEADDEQLQHVLQQEQKTFMQHTLLKNFNWQTLADAMATHIEGYAARQIGGKEKCMEWALATQAAIASQHEVANKFCKRLEYLFTFCEEDGYVQLHARTQAAANYFKDEISSALIEPIITHIAYVKLQKRTKKYLKELLRLQLAFERKQQQVLQSAQLSAALYNKNDSSELLKLLDSAKHQVPSTVEAFATVSSKPKKGDSNRVTLQLFKEGKTIADIAAARSLAFSTIQGHLASFIATGEVDILDLVTADKLDRILELVKDDTTPAMVKEQLGHDVSYAEVKAAFAFTEYHKTVKA